MNGQLDDLRLAITKRIGNSSLVGMSETDIELLLLRTVAEIVAERLDELNKT